MIVSVEKFFLFLGIMDSAVYGFSVVSEKLREIFADKALNS